MGHVKVEEQDNVVHITLDRGEKYNALGTEQLAEFAYVLDQVQHSEAQVVVLSGNGDGFCAGGDLAMMQAAADRDIYDQVMDDIEYIVKSFYTMPKVVIAAVHGPVVGLGLSIALSSDYVMAEAGSRLSMNFIGIGLAPDGGGHFWLQERLGTHQAKHFTWKGEQMSASEAYEYKLIDQVVERPVQQEARNLAEYWSRRPLRSMIATKDIYHKYGLQKLQAYLTEERETQWKLRHTVDHKEGVQAFMEKRTPKFHGK
ncbi:enoyl-CoA hydratase [Halobacillus litoralis]|uniref:Enoyl-CoA hydratase n=1 Tax=Halobacillus litoralis TaxID=45668 RepID=A0A845DP75_9BACI|nr:MULTISPECIES: enoyl-CoA hydratase [Halobacillus]MYL18365.1 enoyl-CoA hydratase [Halobacillus litoralis]MYL30628.1 enoyl-CoA hydratase [Halobacillus halophilus]